MYSDVSLTQTLKLEVVVEPTVFEEKLISDDSSFADISAKLKTWDQSKLKHYHVIYIYIYI